MPRMGLIEVNGIRVFAYHGCLAEEATHRRDSTEWMYK
jgi:dihydroneopterin aldolase